MSTVHLQLTELYTKGLAICGWNQCSWKEKETNSAPCLWFQDIPEHMNINIPISNIKQWKLLFSVRASLIFLGYAFATWNEKWSPSRMQIQAQAKLSVIILHDFWISSEAIGNHRKSWTSTRYFSNSSGSFVVVNFLKFQSSTVYFSNSSCLLRDNMNITIPFSLTNCHVIKNIDVLISFLCS